MTDIVKSLKRIDLESITIMGTSINFLWSIILALMLLVFSLNSGIFNIVVVLLMLTIVFGVLIFSIPDFFGRAYLFNFLISRLKEVKIGFSEENIISISVLPSALICSIISMIIAAILYPGVYLIGMPIISLLLQLAPLQEIILLAYLIANPLLIIYSFFLSFISVAIATAVFNLISPKIGGLKLKLSQEGGMTKINSIHYLNSALLLGAILAILGLIFGIILSLIAMNLMATLNLIIYLVLGGFVVGFIVGALIPIFYNFLAPKVGGLKLKLE